jgi:hypothetical protein
MKMFMVVIAMLGIAGCASPKEWSAMGGSRSDGVVKLGFEYYGELEKPTLQPSQGTAVARSQCVAWGYHDAEVLVGTTQQTCKQFNQYGCISYLVTVEFLCTVGSVK